MRLYGAVKHNRVRSAWCVKLRWQGKRHYFSCIPTRGEEWLSCASEDMAKYLQREISREIDRGVFRPERWKRSLPMRFKAFAAGWIENQKHLSYSTLKGYRANLFHHLTPALGEKFLGDIGIDDYTRLWDDLPLSPKTKKHVLTLAFEIMDAAARALGIQAPDRLEFRGARRVPQKAIEFIDEPTHGRVLEAIPERHRPIFRFMFLTGVRPSEARALRWKDIYKDRILIAVTWTPVKGGEELRPPKNGREEFIPMYDAVRELLDGLPRLHFELVFPNPDTRDRYTKNLNRDIWNPACVAAIGRLVPLNKCGRHSFANRLLAAGMDLESVSNLLRHSGTAVTRENYGRPHLQVLKRAVDNVQKLGG